MFTVTEITPRLEAVTHDPFIESLGERSGAYITTTDLRPCASCESSAPGSRGCETVVAGVAVIRRSAIPALVLLIAVAAVVVLALHGSAPFGAPPPGSQTDTGVAPVLARALWSVVRRHRTG
jgi:hypothetical protein